MRQQYNLLLLLILASASNATFGQSTAANEKLYQLFDHYHEESLKLFPISATYQGDNRYNDQLPNSATVEYRNSVADFYSKYQRALQQFDRTKLNEQDRISYDILMDITSRELGLSKFHPEYFPITQMYSLSSTVAQLGSGTGAQPFKTVKDYENWLKRIDGFVLWADSAITNMRKGIKTGYVLPKAAVVKIIPQIESLGQRDSSKSVFYGPVRKFPDVISPEERVRLKNEYHASISSKLVPALQRLKEFFSAEYLPASRATSGINALPNGEEMYRFYLYYYTSTKTSPEEVYQTGLKEVKRIRAEMEKVKQSIGFKGSLNDLFKFMQEDKRFMPFKTEEEVLNAYRSIMVKIEPHVKNLFGVFPKTPFEIRKTEAFRAGSAPPQYVSGSTDATRPGIFYVPIVDATKINTTGWAMEAVFLHEAIPGHHYQISLQKENTTLPEFRKHTVNTAYAEGWALYTESLGSQLGCYTDPYQKLGALGTEIHRAIRLVVDAALHTGKMTREQAIQYMMENESLAEHDVVLEIERYMVMPGQATSYKTGELKIKALRDKYQKQLGSRFNLREFHDTLLIGGAMPLDALERYMDAWAARQK